MQLIIVHELVTKQYGRVRLRAVQALSLRTVKTLRQRLEALPGIADFTINARTGSVLLYYADLDARKDAFMALGLGDVPAIACDTLAEPLTNSGNSVALSHGNPLVWPFVRYVFLRPFMPMGFRIVAAVKHAIPYIVRGIKALLSGKLNVDVLDATAIVISLFRRDFRTVSLLTFLLGMGNALEEWTRQTSRASLAMSLRLDIDTVWIRKNGEEVCIPLSELSLDDLVIVRSGSVLAVDGIVVEGEAIINQASMTGEPDGVFRKAGGAVFAGTVVEDGTLCIRPTHIGAETRLQHIVDFIERSQHLKASIEGRAMRMADLAVPFTFALSGLVYLLTRNPLRAASVLLVDYSCALRLATPLAILAAMREGASRGVLIKGGVFLEGLAEADTVIFDKTGTLTRARPYVAKVVAHGNYSEREILRLAACLEEHFPHPVARAVVQRADDEGLQHREEHSEVEYIVAHGIASRWRDKRVLLGSRHYICEDEGIALTPLEETANALLHQGYSLLYLAIDGEIAGLIGIEDTVREEAAAVIAELYATGIKRIVMITGDEERSAQNIAEKLGITEYYYKILPVDKAKIVGQIQKEGGKVIMVGDGLNDAPALSLADVGISLRDGTDLAQEVADVVLTHSTLDGLLVARKLGQEVLKRIGSNFVWNTGLNTAYLGLSLFGAISPAVSAVLHNATTVGVTINAMRPLVPIAHDD